MEQRREAKNNRMPHKNIQKTIKQKITQAKNEWMKDNVKNYKNLRKTMKN